VASAREGGMKAGVEKARGRSRRDVAKREERVVETC
jgi:hypothetical protein